MKAMKRLLLLIKLRLVLFVAPLARSGARIVAEFAARVVARIPGNPYYQVFDRHGFHLLRHHYYLPIPEKSDLTGGFWDKTSDLVGLDMNDRGWLHLLETVIPCYLDEFRSAFPLYATDDPRQFYLINGAYMAVDAHVYYALIRHYQPKRIVEVGVGHSTMLAGAACLRNRERTGRGVNLTAIDPFPWDQNEAERIPGLSQMIVARVQDVDRAVFTSLESGDILFVDSSHVLRTGGDVQEIYLEILPRLGAGVLVHIHDISLPRSYPRVYYEDQLFWNEQYVLQAFLAFNARFEVLWPGNYLMTKHPEKICAAFPEFEIMRHHYPVSEPSAFWMRTRS